MDDDRSYPGNEGEAAFALPYVPSWLSCVDGLAQMNPPKGTDPKVWEMAYGFAFNWEENETLIEQMAEELAEILSQAIEAEREECAKIVAWRVQLFPEDGTGLTARNALKEAANSIRNRSNTTTERNEG